MFTALVFGLIPPLILLIYVYRIDKIEREPLNLIVKKFVFGMLSTIPAFFLEYIGEQILIFCEFTDSSILYEFLYTFFVVALAEEYCKRFVVKFKCWNNPEFNYRFDAIVYCVASALGFAAAENILYLFGMTGGAVLFRLIPVHTICGIFMGVYLGQAKVADVNQNRKHLRKYRRLSLWIPVMIHGMYDFAVSLDNMGMYLIVLLGVVCLTITSFSMLRRSAKEDEPVVNSEDRTL